jgi:Subtilase family/WD40-like Beta Propeller Repeat/RTX calcium-binding nonapeptide repeat (4 copies)/Domain of unknown function DUF11
LRNLRWWWLCLLAAGAFVGVGGATAGTPVTALDAAVLRQIALHPRPTGVRGLDARLAQVAAAPQGVVRASALGLDVARGGVRVVLEPATGAADAAAAARAVGGTVEASAAGLVQAVVAPDRLEGLAEDARIARVRAPLRAVPAGVSGVGEGVVVSGAQALHALGVTGDGVKIGVIDLGFAGFAARQAQGDLPASVVTQDFCGGNLATGGEHGTAVAEIVHEMAPAARLYLICVDSEVTLAEAERYAEEHGLRIVNHSVGWYGAGRGDGTGNPGTPAGIVAEAHADGIAWVNAAGNDHGVHLTAPFRDVDRDGFVEWSPDLSTPEVDDAEVPAGRQVCAELDWDAWPRTTEDLDLYLVRPSDGTILGAGEGDQTDAPGPPHEEVCWTNTTGSTATVGVMAYAYSVAGTPRLDLTVPSGATTLAASSDGDVAEPASSPAAIAVGAACWQSALGSARAVVDSYSSRGLTIDGRTKPDLVGYDAVSSGTYGPFSACETSGFAGTSAAAPHVAGALALLAQQDPIATPDELEAKLEADAVDLLPFGRDAVGGAGLFALRPEAPAGPALVFARRDSVLAGLDVPGAEEIFAADSSGGDVVQLTHEATGATGPAVSRDGTRLAYVSPRNGLRELFVANIDGSSPAQLTTTGAAEPAWAPDNQTIAYAGGGGVATIRADGTSRRQLTTGNDGSPAWSPDGARIAFAADRNGKVQIWTMNADGSAATAITSGLDDNDPAWSPDGRTIAFTRNFHVWLVDADGSNERALTKGFQAVWSPDGSTLAVVDDDAGPGMHLDTVSADGSGRETVIAVPGDFLEDPTWRGGLSVPQTSERPSVEGQLVVGSPVHADVGAWLGAPTGYDVQWLRCSGGPCVQISGAQSAVYTPVAEDLGQSLAFSVLATNAVGRRASVSPPSAPVRPALPVLVAQPTIAGAPTLGTTLTVGSSGTWTSDPSFAFKWRRCTVGTGCADIAGATWPSYEIVAGDVGTFLTVAVAATNGGGTVWSSAVPVGAVAAPGGPTGGGGSGGSGVPAGGGGASSAPATGAASGGNTSAAASDLRVTLSSQVVAVPANSSTTVVSRVVNGGSAPAEGVHLALRLPTTITLVGFATTDHGPGCAGTRPVDCALGTLAAHETATVTFTVRSTASGAQAVTATAVADREANSADNSATLILDVEPAPAVPAAPAAALGVVRTGTGRANRLVGSPFADVLRGLGGNDVLFGFGGADRLLGGAGDDVLDGGAGRDVLDGGPGADVLKARDGAVDAVRCGAGRDRVEADRKDRVARDCERVARR